jgi:hypothetical protein
MRREVGNHAEALVPPRGIPHITGSTVPVKQLGKVQASKRAVGDRLLRCDQVWFEAVIVGGVACDAA